jgi:phage terminase small subunit
VAGKLTIKQEAFVHAYLETGNASEAYRRAYSPKKMSTKSVADEASRLLQHPGIAPVVAAARQQVAAQHDVTVERIVTELARIAFSDIRKAVKWGTVGDGESILQASYVALKSSDEIDGDTARAIAEVSQTQTGLKIKLHDKISALDKLGKHLGLFESDDAAKGNITVQILNLIGQHPEPPARMRQVEHGRA